MFRYVDVTEDASLTGETEAGIRVVWWHPQSEAFSSSHIRDWAIDAHGARPTRAEPAAVQGLCPTVVRTLVRVEEDVSEHRPLLAGELSTTESNSRHTRSQGAALIAVLPPADYDHGG